MKKKTFDAVEMMHEGGRRVMAEIAGMTLEEEVAYWAARSAELAERQRLLRQQRQVAAESGTAEAGRVIPSTTSHY